ncbi:two-component system histidine kinase PnpS [Pontiella agarivorans]|uniref:histidine kinase n=1 Tax=Pontiella agarivorans TaxID=3038953 RepID=A0ABU5N1N2_9BACT|nr:ATP-binding protein [Pontiella agarivorans]MDZ8120161.1 ATP-binding protein [Pontiella agarivorans]
MKKKHLFWLLLPSYWILIAGAILVVALYAFHSMQNLYFQALEKDILTRATLLSEQIKDFHLQDETAQIDALCKTVGSSSQTRFTIVLPDGKVVGDSNKKVQEIEPHDDRPEIRMALAGDPGMDTRFSRTVRQDMMYIAVPLKNENQETLCAVRAALPMTDIEKELDAMTVRVLVVSVLAGILAMVVCVIMVRRITYPLRGMGQAARRFAAGDFIQRVPRQQALELDELAESLNTMSEQLDKTLTTLNEQRNEQNAVLSSMDEGVLAIDKKERIIHMNRVAGEILGVDHHKVKREIVQQVIRYANLQEFIKALLGSQRAISRDMALIGDVEKQIQVRGTVLWDAENAAIGALVVLRDVTQLRHLETVRSDFVANVSHELKTPITSIKGFVETLLSDDWNHEPNILRFLEIISQQAGRLNNIIDDLLTLSRLEQKEGHVMTEPAKLQSVIETAIYLCQLQAGKKQIKIDCICPEDLELEINAPLLEQALVNLIINAVKYSEENKKVLVLAEKKESVVSIYVKDEGFGIERKHLERLFERFYRVDTARSRKLGGTGLGLSIVKHIVQAHDGTIRVESKLGSGSTFTIDLPIPKEH